MMLYIFLCTRQGKYDRANQQTNEIEYYKDDDSDYKHALMISHRIILIRRKELNCCEWVTCFPLPLVHDMTLSLARKVKE